MKKYTKKIKSDLNYDPCKELWQELSVRYFRKLTYDSFKTYFEKFRELNETN